MRRFLLGITAGLCLLLAAGKSQAQYFYYGPGVSFGVYTPSVTGSYARPYYYGPYYRWYGRPYVSYYSYPYHRHHHRYWYPSYSVYYPGTVYYYPSPVYYYWY